MTTLANLVLQVAVLKQQLEHAEAQRQSFLQDAYANREESHEFDGIPHLSFMVVGQSGSGKSELCVWMTASPQTCNPSATMQSHMRSVILLERWPFGDRKSKPLIRWIDTAERNPWTRTLSDLEHKGHKRIDRLVWVINAAWQRGVAEREKIWRDLRSSFGLQMYRHLDIVLNYLPRYANKTEDQRILPPQRDNFMNWLQEQESQAFSWSHEQRPRVLEEINRTAFYAVNLNPRYLQHLPKGVPLAAPFVVQLAPLSYPAGAFELIRLFDNARRIRLQQGPDSGLQIVTTQPELGPEKA